MPARGALLGGASRRVSSRRDWRPEPHSVSAGGPRSCWAAAELCFGEPRFGESRFGEPRFGEPKGWSHCPCRSRGSRSQAAVGSRGERAGIRCAEAALGRSPSRRGQAPRRPAQVPRRPGPNTPRETVANGGRSKVVSEPCLDSPGDSPGCAASRWPRSCRLRDLGRGCEAGRSIEAAGSQGKVEIKRELGVLGEALAASRPTS